MFSGRNPNFVVSSWYMSSTSLMEPASGEICRGLPYSLMPTNTASLVGVASGGATGDNACAAAIPTDLELLPNREDMGVCAITNSSAAITAARQYLFWFMGLLFLFLKALFVDIFVAEGYISLE